jgi:pimeloyl-ACP methyl ester carboxylesterase
VFRRGEFVIRKILKILKYVAITIAGLILVVLSSALLYRKFLQHKNAEQRAIASPNGIDSLEPVSIGGIDQWIEVRGENVDNPILLVIHGGPGIAFIPLAGSFQGPWEKSFTVVEWDQRGAGKTYASNDKDLQKRTMNVSQMEQDTLDVVNYLRKRFQRKKIFVLGHSWGSLLGLWLAHQHPDLIYAYVGVGQVINPEQNEQVAYHDALQEARSSHNEQAVRELQSIAPYPSQNVDLMKGQTAKNWEAALLGPPSNGIAFVDTRRMITSVVSAPEYSLADDFGFFSGQLFSLEILVPQMMKVDLTQLGSDFRVPIFFFEGGHDPYCRPSLVWNYFQTIKAPKKEFVWFDSSGHFPFFEEKHKFADELFNRVLPLDTDGQNDEGKIDLNPVAAGIVEPPEVSPHTSVSTRVEHVKTQGRTGDLEVAHGGSEAGSNASAGLEESIWLRPMHDRSRVDSAREGMLAGFSMGNSQGALRDPGL